MRIPIQECTREQLIHFLKVKIGAANVQPQSKLETLQKEVLKYVNDTEIDVEIDAVDPGSKAERGHYGTPPPKAKLDPLKYGAYDPLVNITIHAEKGKGGNRNIFLGNNGTEYYIPRGRSVDIPYRYFLNLEEARGVLHDGWDPNAEGVGGLKGANAEPRETQSYTYTVNRMPPQAEIDAWHKMLEPFEQKQREAKMRRIRATRANLDAEARV